MPLPRRARSGNPIRKNDLLMPPMMTTAFPRALWLVLAFSINGCTSLAAEAPAGDLGLIEDAMRQVEKSYVTPVQSDRLVSGALKGMLGKLDPHSDYMTEREYRELM